MMAGWVCKTCGGLYGALTVRCERCAAHRDFQTDTVVSDHDYLKARLLGETAVSRPPLVGVPGRQVKGGGRSPSPTPA